MTAHIQFIKGIDEKVLPEIRLTRSRDGSTGTATFRFKNANILDKSLAFSMALSSRTSFLSGIQKLPTFIGVISLIIILLFFKDIHA